MATTELAEAVRQLKGERAQARKELATVDKVIAVLRKLSATAPATNGRRKKRTMSAAARRKIAKAQRLRWAKVRRERKAKG